MMKAMNSKTENTLSEFRSRPEQFSGRTLREVLGEDLPIYMLEEYKAAADRKIRLNCIRHARGYCRRSEAALELCKIAVFDRSREVRVEACSLLACALRMDMVPFIEKAIEDHGDQRTKDELHASLDAILNQNHNFFWDRDHSGMIQVEFEAPITLYRTGA
jgi:hypothetical protein